jgi:glycosyltransferase involved in cell wall biosynthesis
LGVIDPASEGLSVFFPAYNEEENVEYMVDRAREVLQGLCPRWEILLVDDGSTDSTAEITRRLSAEDPRVRLVSHGRNLGFGSAIRTGIENSTMPWIFYTDCDGQFDLGELGLVWNLRDRADIVSAYRRHRRDPLMRLLYSFAYNGLLCLMFGGGFKDSDSSFKLYRSSIFRKVKPRSTCGVADFEILLLAARLGFRVLQIPVTHYPRRAGQVSFETLRSGIFAWVRMSAITQMFSQLLALRIRLWKGDA